MAIPVAVVLLSLGLCPSAHAIWFGTYGTWDSQTRKDAADAALTAVCNRFNSYGDFNWGSDGWVDVYYDAGVSTANASWAGAMTFGGTWPAERVALHEMNHWLGSVYGHEMNGPRAVAILEQFDGVGARFGSDGTHFWPYGLNYDSEWSEVGAQRNIAIMYAQRGDWGVGPTANPAAWAATTVTLTGSDAVGESGFNFGNKWSDNTFAHPNAAYSTGAYSIRTPQGYPGWKFAGSSLTINAGGQLLYNSWGTDGVITINGLTLDGGTLKHDQFPQDIFQLGGSVTLAAAGGMVNAANGPIRILAPVGGTGSLTKNGGYTTTLTTINTFTGGTVVNAGTLALARLGKCCDRRYSNHYQWRNARPCGKRQQRLPRQSNAHRRNDGFKRRRCLSHQRRQWKNDLLTGQFNDVVHRCEYRNSRREFGAADLGGGWCRGDGPLDHRRDR